MLSVAILTTMIGQRSRAEMKANDALSEVAYGATGTSILDPMLAEAASTDFYSKADRLGEISALSADLGLAPFRAYLKHFPQNWITILSPSDLFQSCRSMKNW